MRIIMSKQASQLVQSYCVLLVNCVHTEAMSTTTVWRAGDRAYPPSSYKQEFIFCAFSVGVLLMLLIQGHSSVGSSSDREAWRYLRM